MPIYGSKFQKYLLHEHLCNFLKLQNLALNGPANGQLVTHSKIQNRSMQITLVYTFGLILGQISECQVPFKPSQCFEKLNLLIQRPAAAP